MSQKKKKYVQKYTVKWESESCFAGWLTKAPSNVDNKEAYCKVCSTYLAAQRKNLLEHAQTAKHTAAMKRDKDVVVTQKIDKFVKPTLTDSRKAAELKLSFFIAEHTSINTVDHLVLLVKGLDLQSPVLKDLKLHRTKCAALIKNDLSPCIVEDLLNDLGDSFFSLIVDESTAVDNKKLLCLVIRYFSRNKLKIITTFYRLIEMTSGTADAISSAILAQLKIDNLSTEKFLGLGVDGASVNVGNNHSLSTNLGEINSRIIVIKCICHSLHLAAEKACESLPRHLDYMVRETHNWFAHSTKYMLEYKSIYKEINKVEKDPKKIVKMSETRWLVREKSISTILEQYDALTRLFQLADSKERCYIASQLAAMYKTPENRLYLTFINSILKPIIELNTNFQSDKADPIKLFSELNDIFYSILQKIVVPAQLQKVNSKMVHRFEFHKFLMPVSCINFGFEFNKQSSSIQKESLEYAKGRCREFLVELANELQKRIPENIHILEKIALFSQEHASAQIKSDISEITQHFQHVCGDIDETIRQWNLLHKVEVDKKTNVLDYWVEIFKEKNCNNQPKFENICKLAFALLSLPISNAAVERVFSIINIIKDKMRNKLSVPMVESILHVRCTSQTECINFTPSAKMLKLFHSENLYSKISDNEVDVLDLFPDE